MCVGLTSARRTRDGWIVARALLCLLLLVCAMADVDGAVEEVHLPLPPPVQGALTAGPFNFQFTGEDFLRLTVVNSLAGVRVRVAYRTAPTPTTTQTNEAELAPTSNRIASSVEFSVGTGYLLNVVVFASGGSPRTGHTFVKLEVIRGMGASARVLGVVVADYLTANQPVAWPGSPIRNSLDGAGLVRLIDGTDPAAGVDAAETVPGNTRWQILTFAAIFATDVTVVTRRVFLQVTGGGNTVFRSPHAQTQTASQSVFYTWAAGMPHVTSISANAPVAGLPTEAILLAGDTVTLTAENVQAGDNWSQPHYYVREHLEVQ